MGGRFTQQARWFKTAWQLPLFSHPRTAHHVAVLACLALISTTQPVTAAGPRRGGELKTLISMKSEFLVVLLANDNAVAFDGAVDAVAELRSKQGSDAEFWAPLNLDRGTTRAVNRREFLRLSSFEGMSFAIGLQNLKWAKVISARWPEQRLVAVAPPGAYLLRVRAGGVSSNDIAVIVTPSGVIAPAVQR